MAVPEEEVVAAEVAVVAAAAAAAAAADDDAPFCLFAAERLLLCVAVYSKSIIPLDRVRWVGG